MEFIGRGPLSISRHYNTRLTARGVSVGLCRRLWRSPLTSYRFFSVYWALKTP